MSVAGGMAQGGYAFSSVQELRPRIVVFGVGGAGGNAINNMIDAQLKGVEFVCANTDSQALLRARTDNRIQLGVNITEGLGAGARPEVGQAAAQESIPDIMAFLEGAHMVFVAAGMGGGTGTGAAPVIARAARERGILTVAVVTKPFHFEGQRRMQLAEAGVQELRQSVDTLIVIPNQNLFRIANDRTTFAEAFQMADQILYSGVRGVTDLMVMPGLINLDFADVRTVMAEMGTAMMGTGEGEGPNRAIDAAQGAIANPLLDITTMKGAKGVLINITGGFDMTLYEVDAAANEIRAEVDPNANIILGSTFDERMDGRMRVSIVATGIDDEQIVQQQTIVQPAQKATQRFAGAPLRPPAGQLGGQAGVQAGVQPSGQSLGQLPGQFTPQPQAAAAAVMPAGDELRPSFARTEEDLRREAVKDGQKDRSGFSLFGWMRGGEDEARREDGARADGGEGGEDDIEIPAFLRRQMNPR